MYFQYWLSNWGGAPNKQISEKGKNIYVGEKKNKMKTIIGSCESSSTLPAYQLFAMPE